MGTEKIQVPRTIALVGCDGSGKSTLAARLASGLRDLDHQVQIEEKWHLLNPDLFPECRFLRPELDVMRDCIAEMEGASRTLFLFWLICTSASEIQRGCSTCVVVHDGYWAKHACAEIEYGASERLVFALTQTLPPADLTVMLDVPPEVALNRKLSSGSLTRYECGRTGGLSASGFLRHQTRLRERMLSMAKTYQWSVIDASLPEQDVWKVAWHIVGKRLFNEPRCDQLGVLWL